MKKIIYVLSMLLLGFTGVYSADTKRPEIIFFTAESIYENDTQMYELRWKTDNATKVELTYIGKVEVDGSIKITQNEYNAGPITLSASSQESNHIDKMILNANEEIFDDVNPVPKVGKSTPAYYDSVPRYYGSPYNRFPGRFPGRYPGRYRHY